MSKQIKETILYNGIKGKLEIIVRENETIDIVLKDIKNFELGTLYGIIHVNEKTKEKYLYIQDIHISKSNINKGYGSILLNSLLDDIYHKNESLKYIYGTLSKIDMDSHKERLVRFYEKNGYTVNIYDKPKCEIILGEIILRP